VLALASDGGVELELDKPGSNSNPPQTPSAISHAASSPKETALADFTRRRASPSGTRAHVVITRASATRISPSAPAGGLISAAPCANQARAAVTESCPVSVTTS
jgi:hypothetical protein